MENRLFASMILLIILVAIFHGWVNFPFRAQHLGDPRGLDTWSGTYVLKKNLPTGNLT